MINSYRFGQITVDGKEYTADLIIFPDHVKSDWWRKEGHKLFPEDIREVIRAKPDVVVIGTGASAEMKVPAETRQHLESQGIRVVIASTDRACDTYNQLCGSQKVVAALHITC